MDRGMELALDVSRYVPVILMDDCPSLVVIQQGVGFPPLLVVKQADKLFQGERRLAPLDG